MDLSDPSNASTSITISSAESVFELAGTSAYGSITVQNSGSLTGWGMYRERKNWYARYVQLGIDYYHAGLKGNADSEPSRHGYEPTIDRRAWAPCRLMGLHLGVLLFENGNRKGSTL